MSERATELFNKAQSTAHGLVLAFKRYAHRHADREISLRLQNLKRNETLFGSDCFVRDAVVAPAGGA